MSDQNEESFVPQSEENVEYSNVDASKEDKAAADSEATGTVSKDEVEGLKDSIGGGEVLDDSEGYTRSSNKDVDPLKQEKEIDAAVDAASEE